MTYDRFEDLPVWKLAADLAAHLYSDIQGQRYVNEGTRQEYTRQVQRAAFQKQLDTLNEAAQQKRGTRQPGVNSAEPGKDEG